MPSSSWPGLTRLSRADSATTDGRDEPGHDALCGRQATVPLDDRSSRERAFTRRAASQDAQRRHRGAAKIFLGAAPGVGKTYEMLTAAAARPTEGVDVVVGVVETHGRNETEALLDGFEVIPRRCVDRRPACWTRWTSTPSCSAGPQLVLVDELAHTNAPGSRHPKRYLDVEELLAAGIDVYTTLNIQHIESLNDVVAQITRIRVRETVPDSIIDQADDIEVDRSHAGGPDPAPEGGQGLRAAAGGTGDPPLFPAGQSDGAARTGAAPHRAARRRADGQLHAGARDRRALGRGRARAGLRQRAIRAAPTLVRHARRMADQLQGAVDGDLCRDLARPALSEVERDRIAEALRLAERLGGEAVTLPGQPIVGGRDRRLRASQQLHAHRHRASRPRPRWLESATWLAGRRN